MNLEGACDCKASQKISKSPWMLTLVFSGIKVKEFLPECKEGVFQNLAPKATSESLMDVHSSKRGSNLKSQ